MRNQQGSTLIVSLVMLLLMTLAGVAAMQGTILQERMAGNLRDRELAFEASEAALRAGEEWVANNPGAALDEALLNDPGTWDGSGSEGVVADLSDELSADPAYHVAWQGDICPEGGSIGSTMPCLDMYAVTSRGQGGSDNTVVILQSRFIPVQ